MSVGLGDKALIGGFIITGAVPKKVLLRAIGPSLPLAGSLPDPVLELYDSAGATIATNNDWVDSEDQEAIADSGLAPSNDKESAIVATLEPGAFTAILRGANAETGLGLVEVYDLEQTVDSRLANISTRGFVQTGDDVMIGGFIVLGTESATLMVRAIGPSLPVDETLDDPTLELHDKDGVTIATNDDWRSAQEADIIATNLAPSSDAESAIIATLNPDPYTAIVRGRIETIGIALIEAYQLDN